MNSTALHVLEVRHLVCQRGRCALQVERAAFDRGCFHLLAGEEDSGHELLLRLLGLLEMADAGEVLVEGERVGELGENARLKLRERRLGFVFTAPFLLPAFSVIENVAMPLFKVSDVETGEARRRSEALLDFTGLAELAQSPCTELSPGTQQRVSLARALVNEPAALLIESLDSALAGEELAAFSALLREAAVRFDIAVIASVTPRFAAAPGDRHLELIAGAVACADKVWPHSEP